MAPKKETSKHTILLIVWEDAVSDNGWQLKEEVSETHTCSSIGVLIKETDKYVVLGGSWSDENGELETNNRITIPKGWIVSRKVVKV